MKEKEIWLPIIGYDNYEISNHGRVKSLKIDTGQMPNGGRQIRKESIRWGCPDKDGYLRVTLKGLYGLKTIKVHRLVGLHFIPNHYNKPQINHKDGNKANNYWRNLEWATNSENQLHARNIGLNTSIGETHPDSLFSNQQVLEIFNSTISNDELAKIYFVQPRHIRDIKSGKTYSSITGKQFRSSRLSDDVVIEIYKSNFGLKELSIKYGVSYKNVSRIKTKNRHVKLINEYLMALN